MKHLQRLIIVLSILVLSIHTSYAESNWEFAVGSGTSFNFFSPMKFKFKDGTTVEYSDSWSTKPFTSPPFYQVIIGYWADGVGFQFELVHNKIYADEDKLPSNFQNIEITDGYNMLFLNYAKQLDNNFIIKYGLGAVLTHIDITYNNIRTHGPYQISGPAVQIGLQKDFQISQSVGFYLEGKAAYSQAESEVKDATIDTLSVSGASLMLIFGFKI